jgi:hypothetical protein
VKPKNGITSGCVVLERAENMRKYSRAKVRRGPLPDRKSGSLGKADKKLLVVGEKVSGRDSSPAYQTSLNELNAFE